VIYQSKEIQVSLLPYEDPSFEGFDISGATRPAEIVGGDLYDFISINPKILGVAIGDATGHGFTAALQARDAVIGLRMGISEDVKMVKVLERLNRIIHRSHLTSRFVSLFYMEIENTGQAIYSNAGHTTPYYYRAKKKRFYPLTEGGIVLGPTSEAHYARGFIKLHPGDGVIMVTDGITEAVNETGEEYGEKRVLDYVRDHIGRLSARELVSGLLESVAEHAAEDLYTDDRTVVFVRRLPE